MTKVQNWAIWNFVAWIVLIILAGACWMAYPYVIVALKYLF